ncbi:MAG: hypothetical protein JWL96_2641 [Sphingomonas bacterium]|uniref:type II toxin-antitoxin system RelE/ParE family toxin n=1 Tax=Sphingomonas bacterium TaxID=1895847 RepID=UPI002622F17D|nr:type II toxin-antitoxin system RelE/ParE family toxin [Sphingomonas bacterium]MDB5710571.1 hypothetical protein [Sphingomonas bacterium]
MSTIRYRRAAQSDAVAIWRYIARDSPTFADATLARFTEKLERLADNPSLGTPRPEVRAGLRSFAVGNYILFYAPDNDGITLFRIVHAARDIGAIL